MGRFCTIRGSEGEGEMRINAPEVRVRHIGCGHQVEAKRKEMTPWSRFVRLVNSMLRKHEAECEVDGDWRFVN